MSAYVMGIGGTGSKCVEAFLHLSASGLAPSELNVVLIDQDVANGNLTRAKQALDLYVRLRKSLHSAAHDIDSSPFLHTDVSTAGGLVWSPLPKEQVTLQSHFRYSSLRQEARLLFDALFDRRLERGFSLDEGFRGRPAVGAAAMFSMATTENPFWKSFFKQLSGTANKGSELRVVLFASAFGGTGAAGFPTVAKLIRHKAEQLGTRVSISGVLLLPYFGYPDPEKTASDTPVALSRRALEKTRQSLDYYEELITGDERGLLDRLYLIGCHPFFDLSSYSEGGSLQENPPLFPELLAALAAVDALASETRPQEIGQIYRLARDTEAITWSGLPQLRADSRHSVRERLGQLVRFSLAFLTVYGPCLRPEAYGRFDRQIWFRRLIAKADVDLRDETTRGVLDDLGSYTRAALQWAALLSSNKDVRGPDVRLFNLGKILPGSTSEHAILAPEVAALSVGQIAMFREAVVDGSSRGLEDVFAGLSRWPGTPSTQGLGTFVSRLYEESHMGQGEREVAG